jgi:2-hydroxychromene-2-carboxylate isomerase
MSLERRIAPILVATLTSSALRNMRRHAEEARRRMSRQPHRVHYFHQVDDPYSHLASQVLARLSDAYDIELQPHLVGQPPEDAAPEPERLANFARKDAADIAPAYGLLFPRRDAAARAPLVELATSILAAAPPNDFVHRAAEIGTALWADDVAALDEIGRTLTPADADTTAARVAQGNELRRKLGHYLGATFFYAGEWYWGVDRLHYLEARLRELGAAVAGSGRPIVAPPQEGSAITTQTGNERRGVVLEFYLSLRSPYTAIAMQRVYDLAIRCPIDLRIRPVLPMVMRGLPVPRAKRLYIVQDAKREADRAGVAFGKVCDPVGEPVEKTFALFPWAREQGRGAELLRSFTDAAFAEGVDTGSETGMRYVVERAGLSWDEAQAHRNDENWRAELEKNRQQLLAMGLWGVPSFRVQGGGEPDFCTWGQDRIWLVEREIARRLRQSSSASSSDPARDHRVQPAPVDTTSPRGAGGSHSIGREEGES